MGIARAQVVMSGATGLPEDVFTNTFHFVNDQDYEDHAATITPALQQFYGFFDQDLSEYIQPQAVIKVYNMLDPEPRVPTEFPFPLGIVTTDSFALPNEVAVCLSYHAAPPVVPRRRGRIYIGPLNLNATTAATTSTVPPRPTLAFRTRLATAGAFLRSNAVGWAVRSEASDGYSMITDGWVDDEFDTMRKRGPDSTSRVLFPV